MSGATRDRAADAAAIDHAGDGKSTFSCSGSTKRGGKWSADFSIPHEIPAGLAAGRVKRWHTREIKGMQNVADHTWGMMHCYYCVFGPPDRDTLIEMLYHDLGEISTGDTPYHSKKRSPRLKAILDEEERAAREEIIPELAEMDDSMPWRVKFCDLADARNFMMVQHLLGNLMARRTIIDCVAAMLAHLDSAMDRIGTDDDRRDWERASQETLEPWSLIK